MRLVTNYSAVLALFDLAFKTYKRIDHVVSAASIVEIGHDTSRRDDMVDALIGLKG
jgi:hypothetical protein